MYKRQQPSVAELQHNQQGPVYTTNTQPTTTMEKLLQVLDHHAVTPAPVETYAEKSGVEFFFYVTG